MRAISRVKLSGAASLIIRYSSGYTEAQSNGTVGQFSKRDKMPYPENEDVIEEERVEAQVGVREAYLTEYMELLGNQTLEETVCKSLFCPQPVPSESYG